MCASDAGGSMRGGGSSTSSRRGGGSTSAGPNPRCSRAPRPASSTSSCGGCWSSNPQPQNLRRRSAMRRDATGGRPPPRVATLRGRVFPRQAACPRRPRAGNPLHPPRARPARASAAAASADRARRVPRLADRPDPRFHPGRRPAGRRRDRRGGAAWRRAVGRPGGRGGALAWDHAVTQCRASPGWVSLTDGMATRTTTVQITMPQMGESVTEGTILGWLKQVGDRVEADEPLVEVSTDKVDAEVPAPAAGTLTKILAEPDSTVSVGAVLGEIETGGDGAEPAAAEPASAEAELVDVAIPEMGDSVAEGTVLDWLVKVGDAVAVDDPLVEISTDKVDAELPAPVAGTIAEILVQPDETVAVGTVVCRIAAGAEAAPVTADPAQPAAEKVERAPAPGGNGAENATPVAARIASAHGIDLDAVKGSGPRGRVTKDDVLAAIEGNGAAATAEQTGGAAELRPIRGPAAMLARFMDESRSIPTATSFRTVPVDVLDARRKELKAAGKRISFTHIIAWAIVRAARDMPVMGHSFTETDGKPQRVIPSSLSLGLAVDVERKDGTRSLVVPVVKGASGLGFAEFVARYDELVAGARDNTLQPDAYQGANITLTNPGGIGTVASVPRLMPGQGTIVATGAIGYPPGLAGVQPERLRELGVQKVMTMTSTYDHRVIQGAESGSFLRRIEELLQGEDGFYEDVFGALGVGGRVEGTEGPTAVTAAEPVPAAAKPAAAPVADAALLQAVQAATSVVKAHRMHGHLAARLDPLGSEPVGDPALDPATVNLTEDLMRRIPASVLRVACPGKSFAEALPYLRETYTGTIAYEIEHISDHEQRVWLRQAIESGTFREPLT